MRRLAWVFAIFVGTLPAWAQRSPEVDALLETFFAKDMATVLKHMPPQLQKALSALPGDKQALFGSVFPTAEKLKLEGTTATRSDDPDVLVTIEHNRGETTEAIEIMVDKRISDGNESVLRLRARQKNSKATDTARVQVWMRFEDGEWRIHELEAGATDTIDLDDPELLERFSRTNKAANESSAVGTLRVYNTAFVTYASTYEDLGFPTSLDLLGSNEANPREASSRHAGLVDNTRSTPPYEVSGYRFIYQPGSSSMPISAYNIVARPLEYGKTGTRSFFTDQSGVIRFTEEDREATSADPPLQ